MYHSREDSMEEISSYEIDGRHILLKNCELEKNIGEGEIFLDIQTGRQTLLNLIFTSGGENGDQSKMKTTFWGAVKFINGFLDNLHLKFTLFYFGWLFDTVAEVVTPVLFGVMVNQIVYYRNLSLFILEWHLALILIIAIPLTFWINHVIGKR